MQRLPLAPPPLSPVRPVAVRVGRHLVGTWPGRVLAAALVLFAAEAAGLPLPCGGGFAARGVLFAFVVFWGYRLLAFVMGRLLWRIRTKLILSYLFIAVVPVILLTLFFLVGALFFSGLVASYLVSSELERKAGSLGAAAHSLLGSLDPVAPDVGSRLEQRLRALELHPQMGYALLCDGRPLASSATAPRSLPDWLQQDSFSSLVRNEEDEREVQRVVRTHGPCVLILDAPVDGIWLRELERSTGIRLLAAGQVIQARAGGIQITVDDEDFERTGTDPAAITAGTPFMATSERTDWETGAKQVEALAFVFQPLDLARRLSPGTVNMADVLVKILAVLGGIFLVMYAVALLIGFMLARSITRSVHALSRGTERLRAGDFEQPIRVRSRDQLGELAESFNLMARGIQDLLRGQAEKERLEEELRIARQIQMSLLPQGAPSLPGVRVAALCLPAAEVGGDYYDLLPLSPTRLGLLVADVSGKGTSAALYMAELKGLILSLSRMYDSPAELLAEANRILAANTDPRTFITMTYAVADMETRRLRYARAGHNPLIRLEGSTGRTHVLTPEGLGLGIDAGETFERVLEEAEEPMCSGDVFVFFTDGLSEAMNGQAELFGEDRLRAVIERHEHSDSEAIREAILGEVQRFAEGTAQHDDMTLVILKVV